MKMILKRVAFSALSLAGNIHKTAGVPILAYHSVDEENSPISTPTRLFRMQMEYLKENKINVMSLKELYSTLSLPDPLPRNSVVITFDDGFKGVFDNAFPVLREFGFPATVFAVTDFVGRQMGWERVDGIPAYHLCSWAELRAMDSDCIDVQSHGGTHSFLSELDEDVIASEVKRSIEAIERHLDKKVEFFAYPYGDYNNKVIKVLKECGIVGAVASTFGKIRKTQDPYSLKRLGTEWVGGRDPKLIMNIFKASISGTASYYIWLRNRTPLFVNRPDRAHYRNK